MDGSGNIVLAGIQLEPSMGGIALARYRPNGVLDPTFGDGGVAFDPANMIGATGADLRGCALSVAGFQSSFAIAQYALCCD